MNLLIYTCITDDYVDLCTDLPEGPTYVVYGIENPPAPWTGGIIEDLGDPVRSSRKPKILCPFDQPNIYIDASKLHLINEEFLKLSEEILSRDKFFIMQHPHQHSYLEECAEYVGRGWVDSDKLLEFTTLVSETQFDFEEYFSPLCTIIWRGSRNEEFDKLWWSWYNKGGVRDQLSFSVALQLSGIEYEYENSRLFLDKFTDGSPEGVWFTQTDQNRCGDYEYSDPQDPTEFADLVTELTGLYDWQEYYRSGKDRITGEYFFGDAGKYSYAIEWDDETRNQIIIYTSITNWYDEFPDENYYDPDVKYVCFTDGKVKKKGPWEFREIPAHVLEEAGACPRRLSAFAKLCPHKLFPVGSKTVWLDGCYVHTKEWVEQCKEILNRNPYSGMGGWGALTHMLHPHRFTFHNEVMECFATNYNTKEELMELINALVEVNYDFTSYCSPVLTCIWRAISEEMFEFHDLWWKYSLIGSNRDQISFDCARQLTGLEWDTIPDWESIGIDLTSSEAKRYRTKRHPQAGRFNEYSTLHEIIGECYDFLAEIRPITGIQDEHQIFQVQAHQRIYDKTRWDPERNNHVLLSEGTWHYDPTLMKRNDKVVSIQDYVNKVALGRTIGDVDTNANNAFWVKRLKMSLGLKNLKPEHYKMHVWDWGWSFADYVRKNVLEPTLPPTEKAKNLLQ